MTLNFADQSFELHPSGALFWPNEELLVISDVHLGKITHFRKHGMPIPNDAVVENFEKIDEVIDYFNPAELIFLGDLFHSSFNNEFDQFKIWVENQCIPVRLVKGNHEVLEDSTYESFGIEVESHITFDTFRLQHHPEEDDSSIPVICGHIHPAYLLKGKARDQIKLKCFHATDIQLTLPAFGVFTGSHLITPQPNDQIVLLTGERLIAI
jgi:DNA ligase-associated metallophosphoesterase